MAGIAGQKITGQISLVKYHWSKSRVKNHWSKITGQKSLVKNHWSNLTGQITGQTQDGAAPAVSGRVRDAQRQPGEGPVAPGAWSNIIYYI